MKFIFGILIAGLVAVAFAEVELKKAEAIPTASNTPVNLRDKRGFILSSYVAPVAAVPLDIAAIKKAPKIPKFASFAAPFVSKTAEEIDSVSITAAPIASPAIATPLTYTYSAAVPYPYPAYNPYVPYYYTFPAFYY